MAVMTFAYKPLDYPYFVQQAVQCAEVCMETARYLPRRQGQSVNSTLTTLLHDCAEVCQIAVEFMKDESSKHSCVYAVCSEICIRCAAICEWYGNECLSQDLQLARCADVCRKNAKACTRLSQLTDV